MSTSVASSTAKPVAAALPVAVAPKSAPPAVSFRSVLLGDAAEDGPPPETPAAATLPSLLLMPQAPLPVAAAPAAHLQVAEAAKPLEAPPDLDALLRPRSRDDVLQDSLRRPRAALGAQESMSTSSAVATVTPAVSAPPTPQATEAVRAQGSLEELIPALVRRVQWGGDGRKGTVRMELAAGELAGATLLVSAEHGRVTVHLGVPPGVDALAWQERITSRLAAQNIATDHVEVT